jgi:hypothetical protein
MKISSKFKKLFMAIGVVALVVVAYLVYALAGLGASPVVFADPPAFVAQYAAEMEHSDPSTLTQRSEFESVRVDESNSVELAKKLADLSSDEAFVFNVIMQGESLDVLLGLFAHPEKAQRVKIASALATVNTKFTHDEESGFADKREQFWKDLAEHLPNVQNALYEALITSAEDGTKNYIPYTLAWMLGQGRETVEVLAWAAKHHPDWWIRRFSVYFVVRFGGHEDLAGPLLKNRTHDPDYRVRKEVLERRYSRLIGEK